jgi:hypothetical protein
MCWRVDADLIESLGFAQTRHDPLVKRFPSAAINGPGQQSMYSYL